MNTHPSRLRHAIRLLRRTPGFTLSVVAALAVGMGIGIPVLGMVRATLLRAPYPDPLLQGAGTGAEWLSGWSAARQTIPEIRTVALHSLIWVLFALTILLLAIALINVLTLLLARAATRHREMALRAVLGAVRRRLVGQLLVEGSILLLVGAGLALLVGAVATRALRTSWPGGAPPWGDLVVDGWMLGIVTGVFTLSALLAWLSPVSVAWRKDLRRFLTTGGRSTADRGEAFRRQTLAVVQVAACLILLTSAGLLLRGFSTAPEGARTTAFDPRDTLTLQIHLPEPGGSGADEPHLLYESVRHRIAALPGVVDTSVASPGSWVGMGTSDQVHGLTGNPERPGWVKPARYHSVSPGYFQATGVRVLHGREFRETDGPDAPPVVVVNTAFVSHFTLVGNGVGRSLQLHRLSLDGAMYTVVGVVEDVRADGLGNGTEPVPKIYLSMLQHPPRSVGLAVRTTGDPLQLLPTVEAAVLAIAPGALLTGAMTMDRYLAHFRAPLHWIAGLFGVLAAVALLLALAGLNGVMAYNVTRRTREIGIRMAVGARVRNITRMILRQSLRIVGLGALLGLMGALSLARLLQLLLSGVAFFDPAVFAGIAVLLGGVALLASYRPARRAASVDPQISLRAE